MKTIIRPCDFCGKKYEAEPRYLNRNQGRYCSQSCSSRDNGRKQHEIAQEDKNFVCAFCAKKFHRGPSHGGKSKSGLYFCCRAHKDLAQRIGGLTAIQPPHYGQVCQSYRAVAFRSYPPKCNNCGYDRHQAVLQVHHIDRDRSNNDPSNLVVLCPTCHEERHYLTNSGRYGPKRLRQVHSAAVEDQPRANQASRNSVVEATGVSPG